jgi:hypothetical protein
MIRRPWRAAASPLFRQCAIGEGLDVRAAEPGRALLAFLAQWENDESPQYEWP